MRGLAVADSRRRADTQGCRASSAARRCVARDPRRHARRLGARERCASSTRARRSAGSDRRPGVGLLRWHLGMLARPVRRVHWPAVGWGCRGGPQRAGSVASTRRGAAGELRPRTGGPVRPSSDRAEVAAGIAAGRLVRASGSPEPDASLSAGAGVHATRGASSSPSSATASRSSCRSCWHMTRATPASRSASSCSVA